jgi:DNA-binding LacI/PurR family transcriptional regulator
MKPKRVRLEDVARAAGVSTATVSRVMNRTGRVRPEIAERVLREAERLAFDARDRRRPRLIAFVLGNRPLLHPFHSRILAGAEAYCAEHGYHVIFLSVSYRADVAPSELQVPDILHRRDIVEGFILSGPHAQNLLDVLAETGQPVAVQGNNVVGPWDRDGVDVVDYDDVDGSYQMTRYLLSLGHRDIWFVGNRRYPWFDRCYEGFARAMAEEQRAAPSMSPDTDQPREAGYLGTKSLLTGGRPVTAIFAGSDGVAQGACEALRDSGLRVPADVSVVGLDDIEAATMHPRLTTVHIFLEQIGRQLADMVVSRIATPDLPPRYAMVPTRLVKGESCQPPPGAPARPAAGQPAVLSEVQPLTRRMS